MFSKLKQIKDIREQAKKLQSIMGAESAEVTHKGIRMVMTGNMEISVLDIEPDLLRDKTKLETLLREAYNELVRKVQVMMAKKMQDLQKSGEFKMPDLG